MDLARLRTLRELSVRQTMASVADALFISPSAVSQQIAQLEQEAGVQLIERRGRGVRLTSAGKALVGHAERIIAIIEEAKTDLAEVRNIIGGEIRVAAFPSIATSVVPGVMHRLEERHPNLQILLEEMEPADGIAALRGWQVDVALIDDLTDSPDVAELNLETVPLLTDELYAMLPNSHALATKREIRLADLKDERWALDLAPNTYSQFLIRSCQTLGFTPVVNGRCNSFDVIIAMVEAGCSISVMPGLRLRHVQGRFATAPIAPDIQRRISIAFRHGELRNPSIAALVFELQREAQSL
jgi:DNA-binding transcriptional LysR family regulator